MLPVLRLESIGKDQLDQLQMGIEDVGFLSLESEILNAAVLRDAFQYTREFFDLSEEQKHAVAKQHFHAKNSNKYRGYFPALVGADAFKEGFEIGPPGVVDQGCADNPFYEANVWPLPWKDKEAAARVFWEDYFARCMTVGSELLSLIENWLKVGAGVLHEPFRDSISTLRLMHYPGSENSPVDLSTPEHMDSGFVTLLYQDQTGGLEIYHNGAWRGVDTKPGALIVNFGKFFEQWTNHKVKATLHRVKSPARSRYSVAFFFEPGYHARFSGIFDRRPLGTYGDYLKRNMAGFVEYREFLEELESGS